MPAPHRFDRDTALTLVRRDRIDGVETRVFDARIDSGWWIAAGPNGGYLAAVLLRGMMLATDDPARTPRTQTTHFTARAEVGPARVTTRIERSGRSLSNLSARLEQDGRLIASSIGALGGARTSRAADFQDARMPEVPPPQDSEPRPEDAIPAFPFRRRYETRPVFDRRAPDPEAAAESGGWIRLAGPPRPADPVLVSSLSDAWPPAIFQKLGPKGTGRGVPTVELTVHFRAPEVVSALAPDAWSLVHFATRSLRDGFLEEDGEIWSQDGTLLAQSRQLALMA